MGVHQSWVREHRELLVLGVHCAEHPLKSKMRSQRSNLGRYELADTATTEYVCTSSDDRIRHDIIAYWAIFFLNGSDGGLK
jgi:hypothetical protein